MTVMNICAYVLFTKTILLCKSSNNTMIPFDNLGLLEKCQMI